MSLSSLQELRRKGYKPDGPVLLVVGQMPAWVETDCPKHVTVPLRARPHLIDWRALVGLWVTVVETEPAGDLIPELMDAVSTAGAKFFGAALLRGTFPCVADATAAHHENLRTTRELYAVDHA